MLVVAILIHYSQSLRLNRQRYVTNSRKNQESLQYIHSTWPDNSPHHRERGSLYFAKCAKLIKSTRNCKIICWFCNFTFDLNSLYSNWRIVTTSIVYRKESSSLQRRRCCRHFVSSAHLPRWTWREIINTTKTPSIVQLWLLAITQSQIASWRQLNKLLH